MKSILSEITMDVKRLGQCRAPWGMPTIKYSVKLTRGEKSITVPFHQGLSLRHAPELIDVMDVLLTDYNNWENAGAFELATFNITKDDGEQILGIVDKSELEMLSDEIEKENEIMIAD